MTTLSIDDMAKLRIGFLDPPLPPVRKIRVRDRHKQGAPAGMRCGWTEYQVVEGRKVAGRFDTREQAKRAFPDARDN